MEATIAKQGDEAPLENLRDFARQGLNFLNWVDDLSAENECLKQRVAEQNEEITALRKEAATLKEDNASLEMKFSEMSKLSADMAKKSSEEGLKKALTGTINKSRHKRLEKRIVIKEMVMELAIANGITFPEDVAAKLESLDDETPPPAPVSNNVNVQPGGINVQQANNVSK